jgi:hypothetical protein
VNHRLELLAGGLDRDVDGAAPPEELIDLDGAGAAACIVIGCLIMVVVYAVVLVASIA